MDNILDQDIKSLTGVGPQRKLMLSKELGIETFGDLLTYYPYKYVDRSRIYAINELNSEMPFMQIKGRILGYEQFEMGGRKKRLVAHFSDGKGVVDLVWFHYVQYVLKTYKPGVEYIVFGKPTVYGGRFQFVHPEMEDTSKVQLSSLGLRPYYNTTQRMKNANMASHVMEKFTKELVALLPFPLPETLPPFITAPLHLVSRDEACRWIHYPKDTTQVQKARIRLKFEELFYVQLNILRYVRVRQMRYKGYVFNRIGGYFNNFYERNLPFPLTEAQKRVIREIRADLCAGKQMNRLLQGDVGSGKTLVALMTMLIALDNGFQACIMAPTEILVEQHLQTIHDFLHGMDVRVELLTGMVKGKKRQSVLEGLADGSVQILVGTHAVIEENVQFSRLGIAVIDEQHRFGVAQRAKLWVKNDNPPHVLVMTATPIPRTLAMTLYGDLDVSVIDELPPGRKPIHTLHVYDDQMVGLYQRIRKEVNLGRQVYVVYPLIQESEKIDLKNLEQGFAHLREVFPEFRLSKVHGKMRSVDKEKEMAAFVGGQTQMLVATTVIEVGVNVPNASVMVILDAQRFGLSQLHQLRGRVGRGAEQSYCVLVTSHKLSKVTKKRIDIMCETNDGFRIAEADLKLRGPGDLEGTQQSGMAFDLKIANVASDGQLVQMARDEARKVVEMDPDCERPDCAMMWNRLRELRKTTMNWSAIS